MSAGALLLRPFTVLRTRMDLLYLSDQEIADESPFGAYARLVVTDTAAALGITAIPNPSGVTGDPEAAWYVWQAMSMQFSVDSVGGSFDGAVGWHYTIDSKSMRKVGPDDNIVSVFTQENAFGSRLITQGRTLIQLH